MEVLAELKPRKEVARTGSPLTRSWPSDGASATRVRCVLVLPSCPGVRSPDLPRVSRVSRGLEQSKNCASLIRPYAPFESLNVSSAMLLRTPDRRKLLPD